MQFTELRELRNALAHNREQQARDMLTAEKHRNQPTLQERRTEHSRILEQHLQWNLELKELLLSYAAQMNGDPAAVRYSVQGVFLELGSGSVISDPDAEPLRLPPTQIITSNAYTALDLLMLGLRQKNHRLIDQRVIQPGLDGLIARVTPYYGKKYELLINSVTYLVSHTSPIRRAPTAAVKIEVSGTGVTLTTIFHGWHESVSESISPMSEAAVIAALLRAGTRTLDHFEKQVETAT